MLLYTDYRTTIKPDCHIIDILDDNSSEDDNDKQIDNNIEKQSFDESTNNNIEIQKLYESINNDIEKQRLYESINNNIENNFCCGIIYYYFKNVLNYIEYIYSNNNNLVCDL